MKIRTQFILFLLLGVLVLILAAALTAEQFARNERLALNMYGYQKGLVILNDFQAAAGNQVLYGIDLVRTGDISGERIVPYRMTETRLNREIEQLGSLQDPDRKLEPLVRTLMERGTRLHTLCREELMEPLYNHREPDEGIIDLLIYRELDGMAADMNALRSRLDENIRKGLADQSRQKKRFTHLYLPVVAGGLLLMLFSSFFIILRVLRSVNRTMNHLGTLAEGQSRLDVFLPEKGRDEVARLCRNFNLFMGNLRDRHEALKGIAEQHVLSGSRMTDVSLEHSSAVSQIGQSLETVNRHTRDMGCRISESAEEVRRIACALDCLEVLSSEQEQLVAGMSERGEQVHASLESQGAAVTEQIRLTELVREESRNSREILELLRKQIGDIVGQSSEIAEAVLSIRDLADQTDILAINASIEAAHAGTYGRGFAVVSGEMRTLSSRVRTITGRVADLLNDLDGKLVLMADEERQNRDSLHRLIDRNRNAEEAVGNLKTSADEIRGVIAGFLTLLEEVRSGSVRVHSETAKVRRSGLQISLNMEELGRKQEELTLEREEMSLGLGQLSRGTGFLNDLSDRNSRTASSLHGEIRKMGS